MPICLMVTPVPIAANANRKNKKTNNKSPPLFFAADGETDDIVIPKQHIFFPDYNKQMA